jgi:pilus assembly protein CpaF
MPGHGAPARRSIPGGGPVPTPLPGELEAALGGHRRFRHSRRRDGPLADRANAVNEATLEVGGFEASVHKIKEQVLPRLLERVDPEAAATLTKEELSEEFRPIIMEVLAELKVTFNRREQFALEKVLIDELLGFGPLEELLNDPDVSDIMVNGPEQTYIEKKGKAAARADPLPRRAAPVPDRPAHRQPGRPPRRPDHAAGRRPPQGRQPRQRHRAAAVAARHRDLDS